MHLTGFNDIGDAGVEALARSLEDNSTLEILHLSGNAVTASGLLFLSKALKLNTTLVSLYLSGNSGSATGAAALAKSLHTNVSLQVLCLNGNNVQEEGAFCIGEMLKINRALTHLNLVTLRFILRLYCHFTVYHVSSYTVYPYSLKLFALSCLSQSHNNIGDAGLASVADALNVNSNMKVIKRASLTPFLYAFSCVSFRFRWSFLLCPHTLFSSTTLFIESGIFV